MSTSAFKSTSRKPNNSFSDKQQNPLKSTQNVPPRRSRSVSVSPRAQLDITSDFHNKMDNPLFWVDGSPGSDAETQIKFSKFDDIASKLNDIKSSGGVVTDINVDSRRGRGNLKNSGGGRNFSCGSARKVLGRSSSEIGMVHRRRSPSRSHSGNSESEKDQDKPFLSKLNPKSRISSTPNSRLSEQRKKVAGSTPDLSKVVTTWDTQSQENSDDSTINLSFSGTPQWDDVESISSIPEAEEKTINPVSERKKMTPLNEDNDTTEGILETVRSEVRRAIADMQGDLKYALLRSNSDSISERILCDIAPKLANPDAEEFVRDIRGEYFKELGECEERARKLRGELTAEEHYELELNELLVPEPKTPQVQNHRPVRKGSLERRKASKRLEEEAMAYFDECVSISTFDDSDFSFEDPLSTVGTSAPGDENAAAVSGAPSRANVCPFDNQDRSSQNSQFQCNELPTSDTNNSDSLPHTNYSNTKLKPHFSFSPKPSGTSTLEQDIRTFIRTSSTDASRREDRTSPTASSKQRKMEELHSQVPVEKFLLDRMKYRDRLEYGSMLLCNGGHAFPFSSVSW